MNTSSYSTTTYKTQGNPVKSHLFFNNKHNSPWCYSWNPEEFNNKLKMCWIGDIIAKCYFEPIIKKDLKILNRDYFNPTNILFFIVYKHYHKQMRS